MSGQATDKPGAQGLCLSCGLCCNGVIFASGQFQPEDDTQRLRMAGLKLKRGSAGKFVQPCAALEGCRCAIYADRPGYCRQFECTLLVALNRGEASAEDAFATVRKARRQVAAVLQLLRQLGEEDESAPIALRFRRVSHRIHQRDLSRAEAGAFGDLTVAMHRLNTLLNREFYPHEA